MESHLNRNLRLLQAFWFLREFQLWIPVWIVFLTIERGFSLTEVTGAEGLFLVGIVVLEVPTGAVADRYGRSLSLALGAFCLGLAALIFAFATSFAVLLASFMVWSVAHTLMSGADMALLFDTLKLAGREAEYEKLAGRGSGLSWAGAGIATMLGGPVASSIDTRFTILLGAATCVVAGLVALSLKEPPRDREDRPHAPYIASIREAFGEMWRVPAVRAVVLLAGASAATLVASHYLIQPYLVERGVEVGARFSFLQVPVFFAGFAGSVVAGRIGARVGTVRALVGLPLAGVAAYFVLASMPGLAGYAALPMLVGFGSAIQPISSGFVNRRISSERRATVLSIQGMVHSFTLAALAPAVGFATDESGTSAAFLLGGAMTLGAVLLFGPMLIAQRGNSRMIAEPEAVA
ncbi:MAG: MFS transporter [Tepidiformaceae bacterium]